MSNGSCAIDMGTILCAHCGDVIDTFQARKVIKYYSDCKRESCTAARLKKES